MMEVIGPAAVTPYLAEAWKPPHCTCVYVVWFHDGAPGTFKPGRTIGARNRWRAHKRFNSITPLRLWPTTPADYVRLERQAMSIARRHGRPITPTAENFIVPNPKRALAELDRWAAGAGLTNIAPKVKWTKAVKGQLPDAGNAKPERAQLFGGIFTAATHQPFEKRIFPLAALIRARDLKGLKALEIKPISTTPIMLSKLRDLAIAALTAKAEKKG